jgi:excisionase family DNA binding protein
LHAANARFMVDGRGRLNKSLRQQYAAAGMVTIPEAARMMALSRWTIYRYIKAGVLTHAKLGGRVVVPRQAVIDYLAVQMRPGRIA